MNMTEISQAAALPITGGCLCKAVRYSVSTAPVATRQCWCRDCQYFAAGSSTVNVIFNAADVVMTGELRAFVSEADSGNTMTRGFCLACGTPVTSASSARPELLILRAGTLDHTDIATPSMNIWTSSRAAVCDDCTRGLKLPCSCPSSEASPGHGVGSRDTHETTAPCPLSGGRMCCDLPWPPSSRRIRCNQRRYRHRPCRIASDCASAELPAQVAGRRGTRSQTQDEAVGDLLPHAHRASVLDQRRGQAAAGQERSGRLTAALNRRLVRCRDAGLDLGR
ncbi:MAG: hypothetical protein EON93_09405 [Burkholderiales bacterium]|nr:MAG: hypothetical protein EON93_09405 [Burkholderiales bacterium]